MWHLIVRVRRVDYNASNQPFTVEETQHISLELADRNKLEEARALADTESQSLVASGGDYRRQTLCWIDLDHLVTGYRT